jgi:hypothetical protein
MTLGDLSGPDGNAFAIMGKAVQAMKKAEVPEETIAQYRKEATSGDYQNLLKVTEEYVDVYQASGYKKVKLA